MYLAQRMKSWVQLGVGYIVQKLTSLQTVTWLNQESNSWPLNHKSDTLPLRQQATRRKTSCGFVVYHVSLESGEWARNAACPLFFHAYMTFCSCFFKTLIDWKSAKCKMWIIRPNRLFQISPTVYYNSSEVSKVSKHLYCAQKPDEFA